MVHRSMSDDSRVLGDNGRDTERVWKELCWWCVRS